MFGKIGEKMKDPVCNMEVSDSSKLKSSYKGKTYAFCSPSCKQKFDKKPDTYIKG